ncbi:MAG: hypothetical protein M1343_08240 [Chloroflexi bacterium]|nr:hypothetical protein [Chloroflexota bacterium]
MSGNVIYEPRGRAREYAELAANLYRGCEHGCLYCFAPGATHRERAAFHSQVAPREGVMEKFKRDCEVLKGSGKSVLLSFTCDPYTPVDVEYQLTRQAIETLHEHGLFVQILTKGGNRARRDFDLLGKGDAFATTMTFHTGIDSRHWEPNAAEPIDRMDTMKVAHILGIPTWVSLEPVIDPEQTLSIIRATHEYVDLFKVGTLNHHPLAKQIDWRDFGMRAVELLGRLGCKYYLKEDLRKHLGPEPIQEYPQEVKA